MYSQYRQAQTLLWKLNPLIQRSNSALVCSVLSLTLGLGVTSITLVSITPTRVVAQIPSIGNERFLTENTKSEVKFLFVNPSTGNNTLGDGSQSAPLQTITQALRLASPNTVIILSPGTYSAETGEIFPLHLKPGVAIQGDITNKGQRIKIQGGGEFLSRSFGGQNVTIIGADKAELRGVTVTNSRPRGYGLWIERGNPVITHNTFIGSTQDGISLNGNSAPMISQNYFHLNGANGITIGGNSQPQVRENIFNQTGFGINIIQNAAPVVVGNQIQNNRCGIVVQANARPTLRNNLIQGNKQDGLVVIAQSMPNLGTIAEPGGNEFRNNGHHDINAGASEQIIPAAGNNLAQNRIMGKVDLQAQTAPIAQNLQPKNVANPISPPTQPHRGNDSQINYVKIDPNVVEFTAPQPPLPKPLATGFAEPPFAESPLLPVPNTNTIPNQTTAYNRVQYTVQSGVRYRVVVNAVTDKQRELVRDLVPGAFYTIHQGRRVIQVGVFSDRNNANEMFTLLNNRGLNTRIEQLN
ncbi:DUF1565 domain-containing protein [Umezakia ovalisporum]|jgi:parallel beta-helix repeat protein|uniref:DUF1565 domain-containing protein n=1 Tax=Umezakia ovalisporum TaxID=75695 RepID=UPI002476A6AF|nr:DUF1565 domain-containing protein [Umezakia ovalisporum]MBI1241858.1 DUF1565 domain-containing protein [Nostoc sp. RI_552]MDH6076612.1 DUF1565 domain-containing protein [Umezakia ovalisporum FSS-45]MDH6085905.1 DUF1565 domain-containing protein [Umezakia ovalisporum TAC611]